MPLNIQSSLPGITLSSSSRLRLAIATVTLLSACSTVTPPVLDDQGEDLLGTRSMNGRDSVARVLIAPSTTTETPVVYDNVWERIADGYSFSLDISNDRVQRQLDFYKDNTNHLHTVSESASPFIYEIVEELQKRGMPTELALLPIVESAYNPNASNGGSVGLWQIMNTTGTSLGLQQDWWYDARRDPLASTAAALDYLDSLYQMFDNDWPLALAAYNSGLGTVQRAIEHNRARSRNTDYWSLDLPSITEEFVPRLIAISRMVASPADYGLELSDVRNEPVVTRVDAGTQIDLAMAASLAGVDTEIIYQLNPGYRQWATHPDGPHSLLLPVASAQIFNAAITDLGSTSRVTWDRYVVQPGDTLGAIANRYRTQVSALQQANGIKGSRIIAGDSLLIPRAYNSSQPLVTPNAPEYSDDVAYSSGESSLPTRYEVRSGDSLWRIANRYNVTVNSLAQWNNLNVNATLRPGQVLVLQSDSAVAQSGANVDQTIHYRVQSGDSLARIARRHGVSVEALAGWNNISLDGLIHPGQELIVRPEQTSLN